MSYPHRRFALRPHRSFCIALALAGAVSCAVPAMSSELRNTATVRLVAAARPSIVNIHGQKTLGPADEGYRRGDGPQNVNGMGTGVVIDERGYILTNHHVVDGVKEIEVTMHDDRTLVASLISHDAKTDLALIKINAGKKLPVITIGTSVDLMPGEPVVAIGNAYGYKHTVTCGIISALERDVQVSDTQRYRELIQTDASINPGNSGGPLLNADGELIGINVAVRQGAQGIGFAIPVDLAMSVAATLMAHNNPSHGIVPRTGTVPASHKLVVGSIDEESPAGRSGLRPGDVITAVADSPVTRLLDVERALLGHKAGEEIELAIDRNRQPVKVNLVLGAPQKPSIRKVDNDRIWELVGLRLEPVPSKQFRDFRTHYRGGLTVTAVKPGGPAAQKGIRTGDILVGMHNFETISISSIEQILNHPSLPPGEPVKFYILRDDGSSYGTYYAYVNATTRR